MNRTDDPQQRQRAARRMIIEMIEASMALSVEKGEHPLTKGCNCIVCVNKRKRKFIKAATPWKYRL